MTQNTFNSRRRCLKVASSLGLASALQPFSSQVVAQAAAQPVATKTIAAVEGPKLQITVVAEGLKQPWALAQLPDGYLVTERSGKLKRIDSGGKSIDVDGLPAIKAGGQGGLLDLILSPSFEKDATVFFTFSQPVGNESRTAVARAKLNGARLVETEVIFFQNKTATGGYHFGSRLVFDREGYLFVTTGDRYALKEQAQSLTSHLGKVLRITTQGKPAPGNPFSNRSDALPEIWSYGHRNLQGAALHPTTGQLWTHEHGARGGDEINLTLPGRNYGWPEITHGVDYSGAKISETNTKVGMEQPNHVWVPSIAPSGMAIDEKQTQGNRTVIWVGGLSGQMLSKVTIEKDRSVSEERYLQQLNSRMRDVRYLKNGRLAVLTDSSNGQLLLLG